MPLPVFMRARPPTSNILHDLQVFPPNADPNPDLANIPPAKEIEGVQ